MSLHLSTLHYYHQSHISNKLMRNFHATRYARRRFAEELFPEEGGGLHLNRRSLILTFFSLLDPSESGVLAVEDIAAGFCLFCGGNKSEKLAAGFDLFKEGGGGLGRRGLWR